jgi:hypothetical protein
LPEARERREGVVTEEEDLGIEEAVGDCVDLPWRRDFFQGRLLSRGFCT